MRLFFVPTSTAWILCLISNHKIGHPVNLDPLHFPRKRQLADNCAHPLIAQILHFRNGRHNIVDRIPTSIPEQIEDCFFVTCIFNLRRSCRSTRGITGAIWTSRRTNGAAALKSVTQPSRPARRNRRITTSIRGCCRRSISSLLPHRRGAARDDRHPELTVYCSTVTHKRTVSRCLLQQETIFCPGDMPSPP